MTQAHTSTLVQATPADVDSLIAAANAAGKPVFVDFWAPWCAPCKGMTPKIEQLAKDRPDVTFLAVNVDDCTECALKHGIRSVPTFKVLKDGVALRTSVGAQPAEKLAQMLG